MSKVKIKISIEVERCVDCPDFNPYRDMCEKTTLVPEDRYAIPDWCPYLEKENG